ncbi:MAG: Ig-like domain-containing protein [Oscillospiraceae bacterium]|nr:Ig-like domain-containing protein [Oscillospiraceae bacterium]
MLNFHSKKRSVIERISSFAERNVLLLLPCLVAVLLVSVFYGIARRIALSDIAGEFLYAKRERTRNARKRKDDIVYVRRPILKRAFSGALAAMLVVTFMPEAFMLKTSAATADLRLSFDYPASIAPGGEATISVALANYSDPSIGSLRSIQVDVLLDTDLVEYVAGSAESTLTTATSPMSNHANYNAGQEKVIFTYLYNPGSNPAPLEKTATDLFTFKVKTLSTATVNTTVNFPVTLVVSEFEPPNANHTIPVNNAPSINISEGSAFVPVTSISDVPTAATAGTPLALTGTVNPADATNKTISWSVQNAGTTGAAISGGNTLHTTAAGTATVRATIINGLTDDNYIQDFPVTVSSTSVPVTGVTLNKASTALTVGASETLNVTVSPNDATNKAVTWTSSNPSVAAVSDGVVQAISTGTAAITVTTVDGSFTASCLVTVNIATAYTVTFYSNYGNNAAITRVTGLNGRLASIPATSRSGYTFSGWYTSPSGGSRITTSTVFTADTSVYAHWALNSGGGTGGTGGTGGDSGSSGSGSGSSSGGNSNPVYLSGSSNTNTPSQPSYQFNENINIYDRQTKNELIFIVDKDYSLFHEVRVDGRRLTNGSHYDAQSGSTIITLRADYLNSLSNGEHDLSVHFSDGTIVTTTFHVTDSLIDVSTAAGTTATSSMINFSANGVSMILPNGIAFALPKAFKLNRGKRRYRIIT